MLIPIVYLDGRYDQVKPALLDQLLDHGSIMRFRRSEGWVDTATGQLRSSRRMFSLPERRADSSDLITLQ